MTLKRPPREEPAGAAAGVMPHPVPRIILVVGADENPAEFAFLRPMLARHHAVSTVPATLLGCVASGTTLVAGRAQAADLVHFIGTPGFESTRVVLIDPGAAVTEEVAAAAKEAGSSVLILASGAELGEVREELRLRPARLLSLIERFVDGESESDIDVGAASRAIRLAPTNETSTHETITNEGVTPRGVTTLDTVIVGAGFAGLGMGIRLARQGEKSFVILERAADVGGTWRDNTYPGVACDIPSHLYSFSFAPKSDWSHFFAPGAEILDYLRDAARAEGLTPHLRLDTEVREMRWREDENRWLVTTNRGEFSCRTLVVAAGRLSDPTAPQTTGLDTFTGTAMHSSRWDHSVDLAGKRVGVVGTGASAAQLVPRVAESARSVVVFQRTAPWVVPRPDRPYSLAEKARFQAQPEARERERDALFWGAETAFAERLRVPGFIDDLRERALAQLRAQVTDPALRQALTPDYEIGCKRVVISSDYYPALASRTVTLEASALASIRGESARAESGAEYDVDVLVFATGFESTRPPFAEKTVGLGGIRLSESWSTGMRSHASTAVHGFPNMFVLDGPNASLGHNSAVVMIEAQIDYVLAALDYRRDQQIDALDVTLQAQNAYVAELDSNAASSVWLTGGCASWYVDERSGRLTLLWPDFAYAFQRRLARFDAESYVVPPAS